MRDSSPFDSLGVSNLASDSSLKEHDVKLKLGLFELVFHALLLILIV